VLGIRWTVGDVSPRGFEALGLSLWGAWQIFGASAAYRVLVNTITIDRARQHTGPHPHAVVWQAADELMPAWLYEQCLDGGLAEGVAWKLAPLRCFPDVHELSLDNDVILWTQPAALREWLAHDDGAALLAEDVVPCFGQFAQRCGSAPRNSGIRGLPPGFDYETRIRAVLAEQPATLRSELDEQGLQVAALYRDAEPRVVSLTDVTICSPFPPHALDVGRCGAHFVGLNARKLGFDYGGEAAERVRARHWDHRREFLRARVGLPTSRVDHPC
jgi:hypothetical protein